MKQNTTLIIASLLSIVLITFHLSDDIVRGMEPGKLLDLIAVPILVYWLYGTCCTAQAKAIRLRHHPPRVAPCIGRPRRPHDGEGCRRRRQHPQVQRSLLLHLDAPRARRHRALLRNPIGARPMATSAAASATADRRIAQTTCPRMKRC